MDTDQLKELAPHYVAMIALVFLVLLIVQAVVGEVGFWVELGIIFVTASAYRPLVTRLGVGPSSWE